MPELPEVETIKISLSKKILGLQIKKIDILNAKTFQGDFKKIINQKIINVWRKGKGLGIDLENGYSILFHLKMSGQVILKGESLKDQGERFIGGHPTHDMLAELPNKSTRVIFTLQSPESSGKSLGKNNQRVSDLTQVTSYLFFNDQRKFGWIKVLDSQELTLDKFLNNLGPEPLAKSFSWQQLRQNLLKHKKTPIKVALLDQSVVSGVGNIYACEGCFNAGIDPRTKINDLTDEQFRKLHQAVIQSLKDGIKYGGSTKTHFVDSDGKKGLFLDYAKVYNRDKKPCLVCGTEIKKIKLGGRGTFYCSECQK
jgi:formamidopyrimidine-DNA glycosylase